jgi:hypothetical protein
VDDFIQPGDDITGEDGQLIDLSAITHSNDTKEGLILPTWANVTVVGLPNGATAWDETTDAIKVKSAAGWQSIGATAAPTDATYLTLNTNGTLTVERVLTAGAGIDFTDGGAGSTLTVAGETAAADNAGIVELATNAETATGTDTERATTPAGVKYMLESGSWDPTGTIDLSGATVTFGLEAGDIPDISATYEVQLVNEAGLYAVLGDVDDFLQELADDTTPQLGGDLDVNGNEIQSSTNVVLQLGDNAGVNKFSIQDSDGVEIWYVDSEGGMTSAARNQPYLMLNEDDGTDYYIGIYDTTVDRLEFRRSATVNTNVDAYIDSNTFYADLNVNISSGHQYQVNGSQIALTNLSDGLSHAAGHLTGGSDEIDGDKLDIDWSPSTYTPGTTPAEADNADNLTAHLYGIDQYLAGLEQGPWPA